MLNLIEDLYYGNIEAQALQTHITPKLKQKLKALSEKEEYLRNTLSDESLKAFKEYTDMYNEFSCLSCLDSFIGGFKCGAKLIYDTFVGQASQHF